ncbi:MAG: hypothetical protein IMY76_07805 [Chloroflexi bacterium]|nr:hypothetical protein [Chloroflexota bacterium]
MSDVVLPVHNVLRWAILGLLIIIILRSYFGWLKKVSWSQQDKNLGLILTITLDLQLAFGFLLTFDRLWGAGGRILMEHIVPMVIAVGLAHAGKILAGKATESIAKFRRAALFYSLVLIIILVSIPWYRPLWVSFLIFVV